MPMLYKTLKGVKLLQIFYKNRDCPKSVYFALNGTVPIFRDGYVRRYFHLLMLRRKSRRRICHSGV